MPGPSDGEGPPLSTVRLLEALSDAQSRYIATSAPAEFFQRLLEDLLELTASEYGFIGEVRFDTENRPWLKTHALSDISWNEETRRLYDENAARGLEFRNLGTLFGHVLTTGEPVFSDDPATDPRRGGLPPGHPSMRSFLGLPVHVGGEFVGMIGISNRPGGYGPAVAEFLRPFLATVGAAISSHRLHLARQRAEAALRESEERHRTILDTVLDAIVTIDDRGTILSCNPAAESMFGWERDELAGRNVRELMPEPWRSEHDSYLRRHVQTGAARVLGSIREVTGMRRDGTTFPISIALNESRPGSSRRFVGVMRDISERKAADAALHDARDAAERASRFKTDFLASMSHEIRTPMTAIVGYADMLLRARVTEAERQDAVRHVQRNADYLLALLNDILDLSKIEAGQMTVHPQPSPPAALLAGVVSLLRPRATEKGISLDVVFEGPVPVSVRTDPLRLRQVLMNLTSNAVKFTDRGGVTIRIRFTPPSAPGAQGTLRFTVEDTGVGIDEAHLPHLFSAFTQFHGPGAGRPAGTGLGLAISKRLAEALGGGVGATSKAGVGSAFTVAIPVAPEDCVRLDTDPGITLLPAASPRVSGVRLDGLRLLVVDDNPDNQRIERFVLEDAGAAVDTADDGRRGADAVLAAAAASRPYDAVLMDMQMPVLDGYAATAELRRAGIRTPVIAVTAHALSEDASRCLAAGCDAYLTKPLVPDALIGTIARLTHRAPRTTGSAAPAAATRTPAAGGTAAGSAAPPAPAATEASPANPARPRRPSPFDDPAFQELIDEYVASLAPHAASIRTAIAGADRDGLRVLSHRLRGTGTSFGFPRVTETAAALEDALRAKASASVIASRAAELIEVLETTASERAG